MVKTASFISRRISVRTFRWKTQKTFSILDTESC